MSERQSRLSDLEQKQKPLDANVQLQALREELRVMRARNRSNMTSERAGKVGERTLGEVKRALGRVIIEPLVGAQRVSFRAWEIVANLFSRRDS